MVTWGSTRLNPASAEQVLDEAFHEPNTANANEDEDSFTSSLDNEMNRAGPSQVISNEKLVEPSKKKRKHTKAVATMQNAWTAGNGEDVQAKLDKYWAAKDHDKYKRLY